MVVDPDGDVAQAAFLFPQNANCQRFGRARDALTDDDDDDPSEVDLSAQTLDPNASLSVHLAFSIDSSPKDVSKDFISGSDRETYDIPLANMYTSGFSSNQFSISVDWCTGNLLIRCLAPDSNCIQPGYSWILYVRKQWGVLDLGATTNIKISERMKLVVHDPGRENREPAYSNILQNYFKRCQNAVLETIT